MLNKRLLFKSFSNRPLARVLKAFIPIVQTGFCFSFLFKHCLRRPFNRSDCCQHNNHLGSHCNKTNRKRGIPKKPSSWSSFYLQIGELGIMCPDHLRVFCTLYGELAQLNRNQNETKSPYSLSLKGCRSKPCTPGGHQNRWRMMANGCSSTQNGAIGYAPWPKHSVERPWAWRRRLPGPAPGKQGDPKELDQVRTKWVSILRESPKNAAFSPFPVFGFPSR